MGLPEIISLSHEYGSDAQYLIAGGGNTSYKDEKYLHIKASGFALSTIDAEGFVTMERVKLASIWKKDYPSDPTAREARALADLMAAKAPGQEGKRPSVETLLHETIPDRYIVHTHPALINGLTCGKEGLTAAVGMFGETIVWVPTVNPGYILAATVKQELEDFARTSEVAPDYIFLQNHGVFVSGATPEEIREKYKNLFKTVKKSVLRIPDRSKVSEHDDASAEWSRILKHAYAAASGGRFAIRHHSDRETSLVLKDRDSFAPVSSAFTPDHIVYCGHAPLYLESLPADMDATVEMLRRFELEHGVLPKLIAVKDMGVYGCGPNQMAADNAVAMFGDAVNIAVYAGSFGGSSPMPPAQIDFIRGWEVEHYRTKVSLDDGGGSS